MDQMTSLSMDDIINKLRFLFIVVRALRPPTSGSASLLHQQQSVKHRRRPFTANVGRPLQVVGMFGTMNIGAFFAAMEERISKKRLLNLIK